MLYIFICEDDSRYQKMIHDCISKYIGFEEYDIEIALTTAEPNKIIDKIKERKVHGLYFLDVELEGGYNGVKIAKEIRQHDPRGFIAFVTAHPKYMSLTFDFKVEALAYIQKTTDDEVMYKICSCIEDAYAKHVSRSDEGRFIFKTQNGRKISCEYEEILFFQTDARGTARLILHTKKRQYTFYGSLDDVLQTLPKGLFYLCHKSCIVNISNLTESNLGELSAGKPSLVMQNGAECRISARKRNALIKMVEGFNPEQAGGTNSTVQGNNENGGGGSFD